MKLRTRETTDLRDSLVITSSSPSISFAVANPLSDLPHCSSSGKGSLRFLYKCGPCTGWASFASSGARSVHRLGFLRSLGSLLVLVPVGCGRRERLTSLLGP